MIIWITGLKDSGKTFIGELLSSRSPSSIYLDADEMRKLWPHLGYSYQHRIENNKNLARLARSLEKQGFNIVVSSVCPYKKLRKELKETYHINFIQLRGGEDTMNCPYEED